MVVMDTTYPVIQLCIQGTRAEFEHRREDVRKLYQQAWDASTDPESSRWNPIALDRAIAVNDGRLKEFDPLLYLPLRHSFELKGKQADAHKYYDLAAELLVVHWPD